ncbi:hypothetical protein jhhlp_002134 [Lomentospora prolificans]|uniref:Bola-like protein n=1 Tax=Lomentospora prolificans TaxID=41688 RepID=A0A2N3ND80_9PEZI|nr:hypothetical protein jhhlp_002134 [Lomentospora prolificans]
MFLRAAFRRPLRPTLLPSRLLATTPIRASAPSSAAQAPSSTVAPQQPALTKPTDLDAEESAIWDQLVANLSPTALTVRDVSGGCGSMYAIDVVSPAFKGVSLLKQQRMVNAVLGDRVKSWHGLQLRTKAA